MGPAQGDDETGDTSNGDGDGDGDPDDGSDLSGDDGSDDDVDSSDDGNTGEDGTNDESPRGVPEPECSRNEQCGISFQCLACGLTDSEGWCFQTQDCSFDDDCGPGGKCGYNVEDAAYRCLPSEYCE